MAAEGYVMGHAPRLSASIEGDDNIEEERADDRGRRPDINTPTSTSSYKVYALKVGFAATASSIFILVPSLYNVFGNQGVWAIMTVAVVFEETLGLSTERSLFRFVGTIIGALAGGPVLLFANRVLQPNWQREVFIGAAIFLWFTFIVPLHVLQRYSRYRYVFITLAVTFPLVVLTQQDAGQIAVWRVVMVFAGILITFITSFIYPNIASGKLVQVCDVIVHDQNQLVSARCYDSAAALRDIWNEAEGRKLGETLPLKYQESNALTISRELRLKTKSFADSCKYEVVALNKKRWLLNQTAQPLRIETVVCTLFKWSVERVKTSSLETLSSNIRSWLRAVVALDEIVTYRVVSIGAASTLMSRHRITFGRLTKNGSAVLAGSLLLCMRCMQISSQYITYDLAIHDPAGYKRRKIGTITIGHDHDKQQQEPEPQDISSPTQTVLGGNVLSFNFMTLPPIPPNVFALSSEHPININGGVTLTSAADMLHHMHHQLCDAVSAVELCRFSSSLFERTVPHPRLTERRVSISDESGTDDERLAHLPDGEIDMKNADGQVMYEMFRKTWTFADAGAALVLVESLLAKTIQVIAEIHKAWEIAGTCPMCTVKPSETQQPREPASITSDTAPPSLPTE